MERIDPLTTHAHAHTYTSITHVPSTSPALMQHRSYVPASTKTHACMQVSVYNSIHTFEYACVRIEIHATMTDIFWYVDTWQRASVSIHTHIETHTHVHSKRMVIHMFRLPIHGQMCSHMLLYRHVCIYLEREKSSYTRARALIHASK